MARYIATMPDGTIKVGVRIPRTLGHRHSAARTYGHLYHQSPDQGSWIEECACQATRTCTRRVVDSLVWVTSTEWQVPEHEMVVSGLDYAIDYYPPR